MEISRFISRLEVLEKKKRLADYRRDQRRRKPPGMGIPTHHVVGSVVPGDPTGVLPICFTPPDPRPLHCLTNLSLPHPPLKQQLNSSNQPRSWPHYNLTPYQLYQPSLRRVGLNQSNKSLNQNYYRKEFLAICTMQTEPLTTGKLRHIWNL